MSINLSPRPYSGGLLQIGEEASKRIVHEIANRTLGDATIFRISPDLRHRVTNVEGAHPRVAYAGWFLARPTYSELLADRGRRAHAVS